jgi:hypothetical protein
MHRGEGEEEFAGIASNPGGMKYIVLLFFVMPAEAGIQTLISL